MLGYLVLGVSSGMRTMTATAVMCWCAWLGVLPETGWARWSAYLVSAIVFTVFALGEYYGDTRPEAPDRTAAPPLLARLAFGVLVGALAARSLEEPLVGGMLIGGIGVLIGAFGGLWLRLWAARKLGNDLAAALCDSALALALALLGAALLHHDRLMAKFG